MRKSKTYKKKRGGLGWSGSCPVCPVCQTPAPASFGSMFSQGVALAKQRAEQLALANPKSGLAQGLAFANSPEGADLLVQGKGFLNQGKKMLQTAASNPQLQKLAQTPAGKNMFRGIGGRSRKNGRKTRRNKRRH